MTPLGVSISSHDDKVLAHTSFHPVWPVSPVWMNSPKATRESVELQEFAEVKYTQLPPWQANVTILVGQVDEWQPQRPVRTEEMVCTTLTCVDVSGKRPLFKKTSPHWLGHELSDVIGKKSGVFLLLLWWSINRQILQKKKKKKKTVVKTSEFTDVMLSVL